MGRNKGKTNFQQGRPNVKYRMCSVLGAAGCDYDSFIASHRADLFRPTSDTFFDFIVALFAAATAAQFGAVEWEEEDKEWIVVDYAKLAERPLDRHAFFHNLKAMDFQTIERDETNPFRVSYFHPDFNFNYPEEIARLVNGSGGRKRAKPAKVPNPDPIINPGEESINLSENEMADVAQLWDETNHPQIESWARECNSLEEVARAIGISDSSGQRLPTYLEMLNS